jgi:NAD(P)-dependent dehydrogenase (short-subunit alcohol dehydrogenase family)
VFGPFLAIKHFLPLLRRGTTPQIINVSSSLGSLTIGTDPGHPLFGLNMLAYNSSKTALNALTVGFAKELATDGISVTSICPGWVRTDMGGDDAPRSVEQGARIILSVASDPQPGVSRFVDDAGAVAW